MFEKVVSTITSGLAYGFDDRKGYLAPGYDVDLMMFGLDPEYTITAKSLCVARSAILSTTPVVSVNGVRKLPPDGGSGNALSG